LYIDFHLHAFADKIAEKAIGELQKHLREVGLDDTAYSDGTHGNTLSYFEKNEIHGVLMPIATKPSQMRVCNDWAAEKNDKKRFWSYGSVYPKTESKEELEAVLAELERIKALGLYGIKFHPDYQTFFPDDEAIFPIYEKCSQLQLPIMFHAGFDPISPNLTHATPDRLLRIIETFPKLTCIFAHMGGEDYWDEVEELLCGKNCYIDTSYCCAETMEVSQMERMIKKHGSGRVLFGSDFPWKDPVVIINKLQSLKLTESEFDDIFYKNALKLLESD
jgi:predicted TIM-barrel fold metal-dependent hydrolase